MLPQLTVSYEVPQILTPVSSVSIVGLCGSYSFLEDSRNLSKVWSFSFQALKPFLEGLLLRGLEKFAEFAKEYQVDSQKA